MNPRMSSSTWAARVIGASALWLSACDPTGTPPPPAPQLDAAAATPPTASLGSGSDASVPTASSVFAPASATAGDPALGRSNRALTPAQESTAMPLPGQNNDHSAPLGPPKRASAP